MLDFQYGNDYTERKNVSIIIDEVDNMFIDCKNYITKISNDNYSKKLKNAKEYIW